MELATGQTVSIPATTASRLLSGQRTDQTLYFVEVGILRKVVFAGTLHELRSAIGSGTVSQRDLGGFVLPVAMPVSGERSTGPMTDLELAVSDPGAAYDKRFAHIVALKKVDLTSHPGLPNPLARRYAIATTQLDIEAWETVERAPRAPGIVPAQAQFDAWQKSLPAQEVQVLATAWLAAQVAFELVMLGTIQRNLARASAVPDRELFSRWDEFQTWFNQGGTGILNQSAGHIATRPYSSNDLIVASMRPISDVLPYAAWVGVNVDSGA
jgi:hypothetical protein